MVELQIINKVLKNKSLAVLFQNGVTEEHFITYKDEFKFITDHFNKYGVVPDTLTFLSYFDEFDLLDVAESDEYLIETLHEQFLYSLMVPFVNEIATKVTDNADDAVQYALAQLEMIKKMNTKFKRGHDIVKNAPERTKEYQARNSIKGLLGISTGIDELDEILHGWLKEDFVVIPGRTNEGKTWLLLFFLVVAWICGKKVLLYSGEMSHMAVGFRFDTLDGHFSNSGLMKGAEDLGTQDEPKTSKDYMEYATNLSKSDVPFIVVTPKDIGGQRLTIPILHQLIELYEPDIVGLDQLSLMDDYRSKRGDQERIKYTHISEDIYLTSEKYGIPILSPVQANRESAKDKSEETPELHQIAESDGVPQNATRVIAMKKLGNTLKITVRKNRYGAKDQEILLLWDIDKGIVRPFLRTTVQEGTEQVITAQSIGEGEELF